MQGPLTAKGLLGLNIIKERLRSNSRRKNTVGCYDQEESSSENTRVFEGVVENCFLDRCEDETNV